MRTAGECFYCGFIITDERCCRYNLTAEQKAIIEHAYKNGAVGYCTETTDPDIMKLIYFGLFDGPQGVGMVGKGCGVYHLTAMGKKRAKAKGL